MPVIYDLLNHTMSFSYLWLLYTAKTLSLAVFDFNGTKLLAGECTGLHYDFQDHRSQFAAKALTASF